MKRAALALAVVLALAGLPPIPAKSLFFGQRRA